MLERWEGLWKRFIAHIRNQAKHSPDALAILALERDFLTYRRLQQHLETIVLYLEEYSRDASNVK